MSSRKQYYEALANTVLSGLRKRNMEGYYCPTKQEAVAKALSFLYDGATITWGGSMSLNECGVIRALENGNYNLLDRANAITHEEIDKIYRDAFSSDFYFTSSNAITIDGILHNVDGNGNRVAAMIYGPKEVIIIAGMNKICIDEEEARKRTRNIAAPLNTLRLNKNTPCTKTGKCHDCLTPECICNYIVTTRYSRVAGRIKVILVGENLGY